MQKEIFFGVDVSVLTYDLLRTKITEDIKNNFKSTIIAINPEKLMIARKNLQLRNLLNSSTYKIADGVGVVIASKIKKGNIKSRITGIDCMDMLCQLSNDKGYKIFMYGAKEKIINQAKINLEKKYPEIKIVGYINGYEKDNELIIDKINKEKPDILFVALGSPKQEFWIKENMERLDVNIFQGVGGSFDVLSDNIKRAPKWMQNIGLEWFYRLIKEPSRIGRQLKLFKFLILIVLGRN